MSYRVIDTRCKKYVGDNDATSPELMCIRGVGHPGACDNTKTDYQAFATAPDGERTAISHVYERREDALDVMFAARLLLSGWTHFNVSGPFNNDGNVFHYGNEIKTCLSRSEARELLERMGWKR